MTAKGLKFEEHKELGTSLEIIRDALLKNCLTVEHHYGKTSKDSHKLFMALKYIDIARSLLDDRVFVEYRDEKSFDELVNVYYPGNINEV